MKRIGVLFVTLLSFSAAYADAVTMGAPGGNEEESCMNAKEKVKGMIEGKGATVGKYSDCDCTQKPTVVVCKVTGYYSPGGSSSSDSK